MTENKIKKRIKLFDPVTDINEEKYLKNFIPLF